MRVITSHINVSTKGNTDIIDITEKVQAALKKCGLKEGSALIFVPGSTGALTTIEYEPNLIKDTKDLFEKIAPSAAQYAHRFTWNDDNGHSHLRASILGPSLVVPFIDCTLVLGTWQQIVFADFDTTGRKRRLILQFTGT